MQVLLSSVAAILLFAGIAFWSLRKPTLITGPIPPRPKPVPIPRDFEEAVAAVRRHIEAKPIEVRSDGYWLHHCFGMSIRNAWGLWGGNGSSPLVSELNAIGLFHADDMSGLIIDCALRDLAGEPRRIDEEVAKYRNHWKRHGVNPDTGAAEGAPAA